MSAVDATVVETGPLPGTRPRARAAGGAARSLSGEKAQRIVDAMRRSVAQRGTAGSTFDHVSREAGVSRGLLHYYFGTKEQLLVEAVRRDCELRMERSSASSRRRKTADDFIDLMAQNLQETMREDPDFVTLVFELFTLSRRNADIAVEYAGLMRRTREQVAGDAGGRPATRACCACTPSPRRSPRSCSRSATASRCGCSTEPDRDFTRDDPRGHRVRARAADRLETLLASRPLASTLPVVDRVTLL